MNLSGNACDIMTLIRAGSHSQIDQCKQLIQIDCRDVAVGIALEQQ